MKKRGLGARQALEQPMLGIAWTLFARGWRLWFPGRVEPESVLNNGFSRRAGLPADRAERNRERRRDDRQPVAGQDTWAAGGGAQAVLGVIDVQPDPLFRR